MKKQIRLSKLIAKTEQALKRFDISQGTKGKYHNQGFEKIQRYYNSHGLIYYSYESVDSFVLLSRNLYEKKQSCRSVFVLIRKAAAMLKEYYETGTLNWNHLSAWGHISLLPCFEKLLSDFSTYMKDECHFTSGTITVYGGGSYHFLSFLEQTGHVDLSRITLKTVSNFFPVIALNVSKSMKNIFASLRCFARFLNEKKLLPIDITPALIGVPAPRRKLQPNFTREEAEKILAVIDRSTPIGKRDYATFFLAKNTGLRSSDIVNLKLNNIDWIKQEIKLTQKKTGTPLLLPLDVNVGNAIADYILNVRPSCDSPFVFIRIDRPYRKLCPHSLNQRLVLYMKKADIPHTPGDWKGMHAFRRGIGIQMLEAEIPMATISNILGHTNIDSITPYLRSDFKQLQCCASGLNDVPVTQEALQ